MKRKRIFWKGLILIILLFLLNQFSRWLIAEEQVPPGAIRWYKDNSLMILIPAGDFWMGSDKSINAEYMAPNEKPKHKVYLEAYYIDKFEVTNHQYLNFCKDTGHPFPIHLKGGVIPAGKENHPVVNVSWYDAEAYCKWAGKRLPSEAEWEKAARGTDARVYPWGNGWDPKLCNNRMTPNEDTMPVGSFPKGASPYGVMDMAGNVWEWVEDWYKSYPGASKSFDETGKTKITRGGAYFYSIFLLLTTSRHPLPPEDRSEYGGFRCAVSADKVKLNPEK